MEIQMLKPSIPAEAVSQPKTYQKFFSWNDMCRTCKNHVSLCSCTDRIGDTLTLKQELFLRCYTQNEVLAGNATLSYAYAYGYDLENASHTQEIDADGHEIMGTSDYDRMYSNVATMGSRLLKNAKISKFIDKFFNELLTDERVDRELAKMITGYDGAVKMAAIREYNALKQRITKKVELNTKGSQINLNDEQKKKLDLILGITV